MNGTPILRYARLPPIWGMGWSRSFRLTSRLRRCHCNAGNCFPPETPTGFERPMDEALRQVVVTSIGHRRGEGLALVEAVD